MGVLRRYRKRIYFFQELEASLHVHNYKNLKIQLKYSIAISRRTVFFQTML